MRVRRNLTVLEVGKSHNDMATAIWQDGRLWPLAALAMRLPSHLPRHFAFIVRSVRLVASSSSRLRQVPEALHELQDGQRRRHRMNGGKYSGATH